LRPPSSRAARAVGSRCFSVGGPIWGADDAGAPVVSLYTKEGCTLCDEAVAVLSGLRPQAPHSLVAVDITDAENKAWFERYKYDIPVLHVNGAYWAKHRLTEAEARAALAEARDGAFMERPGQPDAGRLKR